MFNFCLFFSSFSDFRQRVQSQFYKMMLHHRMVSRQKQELSLGLTLVAISVLFIVCQSVKLIPDLYELFCSSTGITTQSTSGQVTCHTTITIDTLIRFIYLLIQKVFRNIACMLGVSFILINTLVCLITTVQGRLLILKENSPK